MLGQSARSIWRTCKYFLTVKTGCMDPTNIIMFLLFFCVTGAMAVDPQLQKSQWNVLSGVTVWNGKPQYEFRINWFLLLCGALGAIVQDGCIIIAALGRVFTLPDWSFPFCPSSRQYLSPTSASRREPCLLYTSPSPRDY